MDKDIVMWAGGLLFTAFGVVLVILYKGMAADVKAIRHEMEDLSKRVTTMETKVELLWGVVGKKVTEMFNGDHK